MPSVPISGTSIRLLKGIPFYADYINTRWFKSKGEQTDWFLDQSVVYRETQMNFQRINGYHYMKINQPIEKLWHTNYVMFENREYHDKWFYAFVTDLEYRQRNTTIVYFELDVIQTWMFDMDFKPSFIEQQHLKEYKNGLPYIRTVDEGLDYGTEYDIKDIQRVTPHGSLKFLVIHAAKDISEVNDSDNPKALPAKVGMTQNLMVYVLPFYLDDNADGEPYVEIDSGRSDVFGGRFQVANFIELMYKLQLSEDVGESIVSMYVTEYTGLKYEIDGDTMKLVNDERYQQVRFAKLTGDDDFDDMYFIQVDYLEEFLPLNRTIKDKYSEFDMTAEGKLMMYPYCLIEMVDLKGNKTDLKLEYIEGNDIEIAIQGSMGKSNKVAYAVKNYNNDLPSNANEDLRHRLVNYNNLHGIIDKMPSDIPVVNDMLASFLQGNKNSIQNDINRNVASGTIGTAGNAAGAVAGAMTANPSAVAAGVTGSVQSGADALYNIKGIGAKQKDINNQPAQIDKEGDNIEFTYGNRQDGVYFVKKQIKPEYRKKLQDTFRMFGYKYGAVGVPNMTTRKSWNFIKTQNCNIMGDIVNDHINKIKDVFNNGITLWHTDDIGNYELDNKEV